MKCRDRIHVPTNGTTLKELEHDDNHRPDPTTNNVSRIRRDIRNEATQTHHKAQDIIARATAIASDAATV